MQKHLRASWWFATALLVAVVAGGAVPRGRRSPLQAPGLIGYLYLNEGTADGNDAEADNVVDPDGGRLDHLWILEDVPGAPSLLGAGERTLVTLPLGVHSIAHRVRNPKGLVAFARFGVTVVDRTPPEAAAMARPGVLWPPNHRLVPVHVDLVPSDACASSIGVSLLGARSSEPDDAPGSGDGRTLGDIAGVAEGDDRDVLLRAERSSSGPGRIYTLTYRVSDGSGNARIIDVNVAVPREFLK